MATDSGRTVLAMTTPPERLRHELERLRRRGLSFRQAWPVAQTAALRASGVREGVFWRGAWREQRQVWAGYYSGVTWRPSITRNEDRDGRARGGVVVA